MTTAFEPLSGRLANPPAPTGDLVLDAYQMGWAAATELFFQALVEFGMQPDEVRVMLLEVGKTDPRKDKTR